MSNRRDGNLKSPQLFKIYQTAWQYRCQISRRLEDFKTKFGSIEIWRDLKFGVCHYVSLKHRKTNPPSNARSRSLIDLAYIQEELAIYRGIIIGFNNGVESGHWHDYWSVASVAWVGGYNEDTWRSHQMGLTHSMQSIEETIAMEAWPHRKIVRKVRAKCLRCQLGAILLTWFNFNSRMDK